MGTDYYAIMGVKKGCKEEELKKGERGRSAKERCPPQGPPLAHLSSPSLHHGEHSTVSVRQACQDEGLRVTHACNLMARWRGQSSGFHSWRTVVVGVCMTAEAGGRGKEAALAAVYFSGRTDTLPF